MFISTPSFSTSEDASSEDSEGASLDSSEDSEAVSEEETLDSLEVPDSDAVLLPPPLWQDPSRVSIIAETSAAEINFFIW